MHLDVCLVHRRRRKPFLEKAGRLLRRTELGIVASWLFAHDETARVPYFHRPGATLFFDDVGAGEPIITTHGFIENGSYWGRTGVSGALANAGYRVIDMDIRGHGRSVPEGDDPGYAVARVAEDIGALADALNLSRFHLLTHAAGGMAGLRYAIEDSDRLLSLISTDTASATFPMDDYCDPRWDQGPFPTDVKVPGAGVMAAFLLHHKSFHEVLASLRREPNGHLLAPYFNRFDANPKPQRCWHWAEEIYAVNNLMSCAQFARSFFVDPNPQAQALRQIRCPNLVLVGEHDVLLLRPSELIARCVPQAEYQVLKGLGHMTAIEDPQTVTRAILAFLRRAHV
jgi:pimeloyl-ACP methyl ester carboxylesterase